MNYLFLSCNKTQNAIDNEAKRVRAVLLYKWQQIKANKWVHYSLFAFYIFILLVFVVNLFNIQYPILNEVNLTYSTIHTPTNYAFIQTYPASMNELLDINNPNQMMFFQVRLHSDTKITENTPVTIESIAALGANYAKNVSAMYVGFFGADYTSKYATYFTNNQNKSDRYEQWTGFAGVTLKSVNSTVKSSELILWPVGGTEFNGSSVEVYWSEAGDKPVTIGLNWINKTASQTYFVYTYAYSTVHVYAMSEIRTNQITDSEVIGVFGGLLFGALEVYPNIKGQKREPDYTIQVTYSHSFDKTKQIEKQNSATKTKSDEK